MYMYRYRTFEEMGMYSKYTVYSYQYTVPKIG